MRASDFKKLRCISISIALVLVISNQLWAGALFGEPNSEGYPEFLGVHTLTEQLEDMEAIGENPEAAKARLALLNQLSSLWRERDGKRADAYNAEAFALAENLKDTKGLFEARLQRVYALLLESRYGDAVILLEQLYPILAQNASEWLVVAQGYGAASQKDALPVDLEVLLKEPNPNYNFVNGTYSDVGLHWAVLAGQFKNAYGLIWNQLGDSARSQSAFSEALEIYRVAKFPRGVAQSLHNLSVVYLQVGGNDKAAAYDIGALRLFEALGYADEIADTMTNLAEINHRIGDGQKAVDYYATALSVYERLEDRRGQAIVQGRLGDYFEESGIYEEARSAYKEALETFKALEDLEGQADLYLRLGALAEAEEAFAPAIDSYEKARDSYYDLAMAIEAQGVEVAQSAREGLVVAANNRGSAYYRMGHYQEALAAHQEAFAQAEALAYKDGLSAALLNLAQDYTALSSFKEANEAMQLYVALKDYVQEELLLQKTQQQQVLYDTEKKERALVLEQQAKAEEAARRKRWTFIAMGAGAMLLVISVLLVLVARERKKSEKLLLNILPKKVAEALKRFGKAPPERFEAVTVYFSDVVNFTTASSTMEPEFLIGELNEVFTLFDDIMQRHGCERIKTIGDAYLGVCGMPVPYEDHAQRMLRAALEIRRALIHRNTTHATQWQIRIGIHTGKVVGGIVGVKKYIYDVFGDTINTASRMESNSEPMRLNLSEAAFQAVQHLEDLNFEKRAPLEVKGKGVMHMYFADEKVAVDYTFDGVSAPEGNSAPN